MKFATALIIFIAASSVFAMGTNHQNPGAIGATACAAHISQGAADNNNNIAIWMAGYLSAYDLLTHNNFKVIETTDPATALVWITRWCNANPNRRLTDAAANMLHHSAWSNLPANLEHRTRAIDAAYSAGRVGSLA